MERLPTEEVIPPVLTIRYHHLLTWREFIDHYDKEFAKPWEMDLRQSLLAKKFIEKYVSNNIDIKKAMRSYFEQASEFHIDPEKLKYVYDIIGSGDRDPAGVARSRTQLLSSFFEAAQRNKNTFFPLTIEPDNYCGTCVVGKHCGRTKLEYLFKNDADFIIKKSVENLMEQGRVEADNLIKLSQGLSISAKFLFDTDFYILLVEDVIKRGKNEWFDWGPS